MARLAAEAKAGYYPAPVEIVRQIAAVVRPALDTKERPSYMGPDPHCVLDPCCGEGEALNTLIHEWFPRQGWNRSYRDKHFSAYACELEKGRYEKAKSLLGYDQKTVHGDAFGIIAETGQVNYRGATVLYLNPPYAPDKEYKRLEERWLRRFTNLLATDGALIFFVPGYALVDSAETLATWYTDVAVLRLDDAAYSTFKQVVLIARKLGAPRLTPDPAIIATITAPTEKLPILLDAATATGYAPLSATDDEDEAATPDTEDDEDTDADLCAPKPAPQYAKPLLTVQPLQGCGFKDFDVARFDLAGLMAKHRPWHVSKAGGKFAPVDKAEPLDPFMRVCLRTYNVAVSPRASHIAAGIAAGVFNGVRIVSTTPGLPPLYIKGAFTRDYETVETRVNDKGEATSLLQHQKPRLNITVLDTSVSPPLYRTLRSETTITESVSLDDAFTIGDLLHHYGASLLAVLNQRCPTLYSYGTPLRQYDSPRTLFSAQSHATAATLKLLQQPDRSCFLLGEIGSGKSTVSLVSAVTHGAKRILIVAPPHLMDSWRDQAAAVLPGALCVVLSRPSDIELIEAEAPGRVVIGVVSRETAKLGHAYAGLLSCSHCGAVPKLDLPARDPKVDPEKHKEAVCLVEQKARETAARLRKRCGAKHYTAKNGAARLAAKLGVAIHTIFPDEEMISSIAPPKLRASMARAVKLGKPRAAAIEIEDRLYPLVAEAARLVCERYSGDGLGVQEGHATHAHALLALILGCSDSDRAGRLALDLLVPHALAVGAHKVRDAYNARSKLMSLIQAILLTMESGALIDGYAQRLGGPAIDPENAVAPEPDPAKEGDEDEDEGRSWYRSPTYSMWGAYEKFARYLVEDGGRSGEDAYVHNEYLGYGDGDFLLGGHAPRTNSLQRYALSKLWELAKWGATKPCESVMYTAIPQPRRFPLARYIVKHRPYLFDFLLVDEAHEYANQDSAQSQSVQQLYGLKLPTIILTGSVTNGYASSLFIPLWYLSAAFRAEFKRGDLDKFVKRYGYLKRVIDMATGQVKEHGAMSMRKETTKITGQIPGVMPELVLRHLLPLAATIHLEDIEGEEIGEPGSGNVIKLPACEEIVIRVEMNAAQASAAKQLRNSLVTRIKADRFTARRGKLFGQLAELPSMLDRFTVDTGSDGGPDLPGDGRYTIRYPAPDNEEVDSVACLPADTILPKEAELIRVVLAERAAGRRVMVFPWHIALMPRLARLLRAKGLNVAELYSTKVPSKKRQAWIDKNVIGKGVDVLFVNPVAVQTGLNNLVYFHSVVWYENPACNPVVRRQARGRVKRIGQLLDVRSFTLIYEGEGALQGAAHTLLLHKVGIGEAVDGLDPTAALQAAGVGDTDSSLAQGIGAALYKMISQGKA